MMLYEMTLWLIAMCMVMAFAALQTPPHRRMNAHAKFDEGFESDEMSPRSM